MRPDGVVILPPDGQHGPCLHHRGKQPLIQALVAQPSVEAFGEAVLHCSAPNMAHHYRIDADAINV
jgi:hypothetical protein